MNRINSTTAYFIYVEIVFM